MGNPNTAAQVAAAAQLKALQQIFGSSTLTQQEVTALSDFIVKTIDKTNKPFIRINNQDKSIFQDKRVSMFVNELNGTSYSFEYIKKKDVETLIIKVGAKFLHGSYALLLLEHINKLTKAILSNITDDNFIPKDVVYHDNVIQDEPDNV